MTTTAQDIIAAARYAVHLRAPYMAHTLFALRPHPAPGLGTLAVDAGWRLLYDPDTVLRWHEEMVLQRLERIGGGPRGHDGLAAVVYHELGHCLRNHHARMGDREPQRAGRAMDREINDDVRDAGWTLPGQPLMPAGIGMPDGLTFEEYYVGEPEAADAPQDGSFPGCGAACGGCAGNPTPWEQEHGDTSAETPGAGDAPGGLAPGGESAGSPPLPDPVSPMDQVVARRRTAVAIREYARSQGSIPAGLACWAEAQLRPAKVNWRRRLASLTRGALASAAGACDFTWRRPGRRALHSAGRAGWPLAPSLHQPVPKIAVLLDTSGSMSCSSSEGRSVLEEALSEVMGLARAAGGDVCVYACDAAVHAVARVVSELDLEKVNFGGGGTSMVEGITTATKIHYDVLVILTDGLTDVPEAEPRRTKLIWGIIGELPFKAPGQIVRIN